MAQTPGALPQAARHLCRTDASRPLRRRSECSRLEALGRLAGFTNCKPKYKRPDGLFPFVRLMGCKGKPYPIAERFMGEITQLYEAREQNQTR